MGITINTRTSTFCIILFGITFSIIDQVSSCDWTGLGQCTQILSRGKLNMTSTGIAAMPTKDQLQTMCSIMTEFEQCYKPKSAACANDATYETGFGTIENTFHYLCVEGHDDIVQFDWCWVKEELVQKTTQCHQILTRSSTALKQKARQLGLQEVSRRFCVILAEATRCVSEAVGVICGDGPACVMQTMMDRSLSVLGKQMQCPSPRYCKITQTGSRAQGNGLTSNKLSSIYDWSTHFVVLLLSSSFATCFAF